MTVAILQPLGKNIAGWAWKMWLGLKKQPFHFVCISRSMLSFLYAV